ncbi:SSRP1 protein, partial [Nothoprocta pentlandii]|nr:SSRP1 protein [Nothoprocta pentlandii]
GQLLSFDIGEQPVFEIPLSNVSQCTTGKNEVTLEFHQNDDAEVSLMEVRFYVPPTQEDGVDPVEAFAQNVLSKADVIQATGDAICIFRELQCLTPRGRYDIRIYPTFLHLHGKTFDYKIPYTTVLRLFLLPHKDQRQMFFVISLDPPIKQGQTRYHFLILLFSKDEDISLTLNMNEEEVEKRFEGRLTKNMSGSLYEMVSRVMKALVNRKITVPGNFQGGGRRRGRRVSGRRAWLLGPPRACGAAPGPRCSRLCRRFDSNASASSSSGDGDSAREDRKPPKKAKVAKERKPRKKPSESKKGKDPNAPKRPMSAYMLWLNASREKIKLEHPGISITDLSKRAGELWKAMAKEKKEEWERKAEDARRDYEKAMKEYSVGGRSEASRADRSKKKKKKAEKQVKGKAERKGAAARSSSSAKAPAKSLGESFKSKEFVSSDESSSAESKKEDSEEEGGASAAPSSDDSASASD